MMKWLESYKNLKEKATVDACDKLLEEMRGDGVLYMQLAYTEDEDHSE